MITDPRAGSPQAKQLQGMECKPTHQQIIGLKLYWARPYPPEQDPVFPMPVPSIRKLTQALLSLIHQRADRRSKKKHSLTAAKTTTILQKVNHNEKAESYVPDEGIRYSPRKPTELSGNRQPSKKIIQNNDSEDDPRSQEKNGGKDWEDARNVYRRPRRTKEQTEMNNTLEGINSRITEAEQINDLGDRMV